MHCSSSTNMLFHLCPSRLPHYLSAYKRMERCCASTKCRGTDICCSQVILCTNIAETSVTVPGVRYVVDTGFVKARAYSGKAAAECLQVVPVSQAQARQRAGRAGAVLSISMSLQEHGMCSCSMYTQHTFNNVLCWRTRVQFASCASSLCAFK